MPSFFGLLLHAISSSGGTTHVFFPGFKEKNSIRPVQSLKLLTYCNGINRNILTDFIIQNILKPVTDY